MISPPLFGTNFTIANSEKSANSKDIIEAFRHFDKDNDGFWSIGDLRYMFNQIDIANRIAC